MDKQQMMLALGSVALVALLFFGFDTRPTGQKALEKSRTGNVEIQEVLNAIRSSKKALAEDVRKYVQGLENVAEGSGDSIKAEALGMLSAAWYNQRQFVAAGYYAEQIAVLHPDAQTWAIAGSTYGAGLTDTDAKMAGLAMDGSVRCFENAVSLDPDNVEYRINLAICYAEHPPESNPMKGIQSLLELNRKYPENTSVLFHLARFGMRTGQYDKAKERLRSAIRLDPEQQRLYCLMAGLMEDTQQIDSSGYYRELCEKVR